MILITSPIVYGLIAVISFIGFLRTRNKEHNPLFLNFNKSLLWFTFYGVHFSVSSAMVLITEGVFTRNWHIYPISHFFALMGVLYILKICLHVLNVNQKTSNMVVGAYLATTLTGVIINIFFPSVITFRDYIYVFVDTNPWVGVLWSIPLAFVLTFAAFVFWRQTISLADYFVRKRSMLIAISITIVSLFAVIAFGGVARNIFGGVIIGVIAEALLFLGISVLIVSFFIKPPDSLKQ